jgi:outer membrane protein assembly factor BamB
VGTRFSVVFLTASFALAACSGVSHGTGPLPATQQEPSHRGINAAGVDSYASVILADKPTAYYRLDDSGATAADSSGNALNGSIGSSVTEGTPGLLNSSADTAMSFPGTASASGTVSVPQTSLLQPSSALSVEAWLRFASIPSTFTVAVGYGSDSGYAPYDLYFNAGKIVAQFNLTSGVLEVVSPTALQTNTTYHVVSTFDGNTGRLYVNGSLVASVAKTGTLTSYLAGYGVAIGDDATHLDPAFKGTIDEVAIYAGKVLSATQVANHYAAGTTVVTPPPTSTPSPTPVPSPTPTPNFGPRTGPIVAVRTNQFQVQFGGSCGYLWVTTNASTVFDPAGATPKVGLIATVAGNGSCATSATATSVTLPSLVPTTFTDWNTFGDGLARTQYNPSETTLSATNLSSLHVVWLANLGAAITAQPVLATNISINGAPTPVLYVGTESGVFYAINATNGQTIWSASLGSVSTGCMDLPGGRFGITGTATFDKTTNRVYVADANDNVHALNMQTGQEVTGWPVSITNQFMLNHVYGALAYNPSNGLLYAETASLCDSNSWNGRIVAVNTSSATIAATFFPAAPYAGAGIWGIGGAAIDTNTNDIYVTTGNDKGAPAESSAFGEHIIQLDPMLNVLASNSPGITGFDADFGATPMLYTPPGCPHLVTAKNKTGALITWPVTAIASGPLQTLSMEPYNDQGQFIGVTAYSPSNNLIYVGDPGGNASFVHGLVALAPQANCTLAPVWQQSLGVATTSNDNDTPAVANGVVYFDDGINDAVYAFNAATGQQLWSSGGSIKGPVMTAPTVDGRLYVSSWDHNLYAFGL